MITILIARLKVRLIPLLLVLAAVSLLTACGSDDAADGGISVVATTSIWADVAGEIVGEDGSVESVIPIGGDAHDYQPSPQEVARMEEADLVIANGLGLEQGLDDVLEALAADGANIVEVAPDLDPLPFSGHEHHEHEDEGDEDHEHEDEAHEDEAHEDHEHEDEGDEDHEHEDEAHEDEAHEHGSLDPHVWFDPARVGDAARLIAESLTALDPSIDWSARADEYAAELLETDAEIVEILSAVPADERRLVTNHDALSYFADRYDFTVVGVVIPGGATIADPSSAELAALVEVIEETSVPAIFAETTQPTRLAEAVAAEVGGNVEVVELYTGSLGEPDSEAPTLIEMLRVNANRISDALS